MNTPYLSRYRHSEYIQYMTDVLALLAPYDVDTLQLAEPQGALAAVLAQLNAAFKHIQGSELTAEIVALDNRRDRAIVGVRGITSGFAYHFTPDVAAAGALLNRNIAAHSDNLSRLSYQEQTAVLNSIIRDWQNEADLAAAVTTLNLGPWLQELNTSNTEFAAKYLARVGQTAKSSTAPIAELRDQATEAYRDLINHITAHATLSNVSTYTDVLNEIDVLAGQYNQTVENRSTPTPTDPAPPTDPGTPDDTSY